MLYGNINKKKLIFEKVPLQPSCSITAEAIREQVFDSTWHYHPEVELTYIVEGSGRFLIGSEWMTYSPGCLTLIGGNTPHLFVSVPVSGEYSEFRVIRFSPIFRNALFSLPEFAAVKKIFGQASTALIFQDFQLPGVFDAIRDSSGAEQILNVMHLLSAMAAHPYRRLDIPGMKKIGKIYEEDMPELERAIRFLQQNFTRPITLADTARAAGMTEEGFRRFFKRHVFLTFTDYLLELRLILAGKLLRETSKSIWEIAELSGFRNLSNFNRLFLARRHMTPREYRRL